jgi:hypothetical protein
MQISSVAPCSWILLGLGIIFESIRSKLAEQRWLLAGSDEGCLASPRPQPRHPASTPRCPHIEYHSYPRVH